MTPRSPQADPTLRRTYRYRLYPTAAQVEALERQLGEACDLYNAGLQQRREAWREHGESVGFFQQSAEVKDLRSASLLDPTANAWSQAAVLRRLDRAFDAFFRRVKAGEAPGFPRFKPRSRFNTLEWSFHHGGVGLADGRLRLQGVGHVRVRLHRPIPDGATLRQARVTRRNGRWYVAIALDGIAVEPLAHTGRAVGIDLGISTFAAIRTAS